ncbi:MAG: hypothetical protein OSJ73_13870 [Lachnospiraceae bacterium]|nr:hypothetical protein [Lachnospiraceae bacterium]
MRAVLTYKIMEDGTPKEETRLFDTKKSTRVCDVTNAYGTIMYEIYISQKGVLFKNYVAEEKLEVPDQKECKEWIGIHEPDKYIEFFGKPEEA